MSFVHADLDNLTIHIDEVESADTVRHPIQIEWVREVIALAAECNNTIQLISSVDFEILDAAETYFNLGHGGGDVLASAGIGLCRMREEVKNRVRETRDS